MLSTPKSDGKSMAKFEKAMKELPHYIGGYDPFYHHTPDDLVGVGGSSMRPIRGERGLRGENKDDVSTVPPLLRKMEQYSGIAVRT